MKIRPLACLLLLAAFFCSSAFAATAQPDAETRVIDYIRDHLQPGQPLLVTELYGKVFTRPEERQALNKLYNAFFRIPLFVVQYEKRFGRPPSLKVIAQQFDLQSPEAADVLLRVMESDPRVPSFLTRDPQTHEITHVDEDRILADHRFNQILTRHLGDWEGQPAPEFRLATLEGSELDSATLRGKSVLLYVWFTGCPPCMRETQELVLLNKEFSARGLVIVAANADGVLGLSYDDVVRRRYVKEQKIDFPVVRWSQETDAAFGNISIFPTLFLIDAKSVIVRHWVGFVGGEELRRALAEELQPAAAL